MKKFNILSMLWKGGKTVVKYGSIIIICVKTVEFFLNELEQLKDFQKIVNPY